MGVYVHSKPRSRATLAKQPAGFVAEYTVMLIAWNARASQIKQWCWLPKGSLLRVYRTLQKTQVKAAQGLYTTVCTVLLLET
jgi:hypothetical protein